MAPAAGSDDPGSAQAGVSGAAPAVDCATCDGSTYWGFEHPLVTAEQVGEILGVTVRFRAFANDYGYALAEAEPTRESVFVTNYGVVEAAHRKPPLVFRLDVAATGLRFVAAWPQWYFLACGTTRCSLFQVADPSLGTVTPLPGGDVPEGFIANDVREVDSEICVMNDTDVAWCFDDEAWVRRVADASSTEDLVAPGGPGGDGGVCPNTTGEPLLLSAWHATDARNDDVGDDFLWLLGVTTDGAVVEGQYAGAPTCCCVRGPPLGVPLDTAFVRCGLSTNAWILTEDAIFGSEYCADDR